MQGFPLDVQFVLVFIQFRFAGFPLGQTFLVLGIARFPGGHGGGGVHPLGGQGFQARFQGSQLLCKVRIELFRQSGSIGGVGDLDPHGSGCLPQGFFPLVQGIQLGLGLIQLCLALVEGGLAFRQLGITCVQLGLGLFDLAQARIQLGLAVVDLGVTVVDLLLSGSNLAIKGSLLLLQFRPAVVDLFLGVG